MVTPRARLRPPHDTVQKGLGGEETPSKFNALSQGDVLFAGPCDGRGDPDSSDNADLQDIARDGPFDGSIGLIGDRPAGYLSVSIARFERRVASGAEENEGTFVISLASEERRDNRSNTYWSRNPGRRRRPQAAGAQTRTRPHSGGISYMPPGFALVALHRPPRISEPLGQRIAEPNAGLQLQRNGGRNGDLVAEAFQTDNGGKNRNHLSCSFNGPGRKSND